MIQKMWRRLEKNFKWRRYAPPAATLAMAGLLALDVSHTVWALHAAARVQTPSQPIALPTPEPPLDVHRILDAHLFGETVASVVKVDPEHAPDTDLALTLTGVVASRHPERGYAILGVTGEPTHLYRTGATLDEVGGGRLVQVFVDRVVIDISGKLQTLRLPKQNLFGPAGGATEVAQTEPPPKHVDDPDVITAAESWFSQLNVEQTNVGPSGLVIHPAKRFQRQYGLQDSDILTAVDGVEITDSQALANTLRTTAKSMSLTFVRDGVPRTVNLPMAN
jgi:general secretion pathway protein C